MHLIANRRQRGQTTVEYALLVGVLALVCLPLGWQLTKRTGTALLAATDYVDSSAILADANGIADPPPPPGPDQFGEQTPLWPEH